MKKILISIAVFTALLAGRVAAQNDTSLVADLFDMDLEQLLKIKVVSASKLEETLSGSPAVMYVLTESQFKERGYQNVFDVLKDLPGWEFETPYGGRVAHYPRLRGTRALRQVLFLIDGVVQNNINDAEMGRYDTYDLSTVERIEVITGPASALYGANALLGVVNIISKSPDKIGIADVGYSLTTNVGDELFSYQKQNFSLNSGYRFANGLSYSTSVQYVGSNDEGTDYHDPFGYFKKGYIHSGKYPAIDNGFNNSQSDLSLKMRLNKDKVYRFGFDFGDFDDGAGSMYSGSRIYANSDTIKNNWHTRKISTFVCSDLQLSENTILSPKIYYRSDEVLSPSGFAYTDIRRGQDGFRYAPGTFRSYKQHAERTGFELIFQAKPSDFVSILSGFVYETINTMNENYRFIDNINTNNNIYYGENETDRFIIGEDTVALSEHNIIMAQPVYYIKTFSGYLQTIFRLNKTLNLTLRARFDKQSDDDAQLSPSAALVYLPELKNNKHFSAKLMYGRAFRALPIYQKYDYGTTLLGEIRTEKIHTFELNSYLMPHGNLKFEATLWYNVIQDLYNDGTNSYSTKLADTTSNYLDSETYGAQTAIEYKYNDLMLSGHYTYTDGRNKGIFYDIDGDGSYTDPFEDLIRISKHKTAVSLSYSHKKLFNVRLQAKYFGKRTVSPNLPAFNSGGYTYITPENDTISVSGNGFMKAYTLLDLNFSIQNLGKIDEILTGISLNLTIHNITGTKYYDPSRTELSVSPQYHPQPGRRITFGIRYALNRR